MSLKQQLEEQEKRWKTRKDFFEWRSMTWRKGRVKELLTKNLQVGEQIEDSRECESPKGCS